MRMGKRVVMVMVMIMVVLMGMVGGISGAADTTYVSGLCNRQMIPQGSPFWGHLGLLLSQLVDITPYSDYYFKTRTGGDAPAFGLASCSASVSTADCKQCLQTLSSDIWRLCNSAIGARIEYRDCYIHYESYYF